MHDPDLNNNDRQLVTISLGPFLILVIYMFTKGISWLIPGIPFGLFFYIIAASAVLFWQSATFFKVNINSNLIINCLTLFAFDAVIIFW